MNKFDFIDWPATVAEFGYQHQLLQGRDVVIIRCQSCGCGMKMKFSSIRKNHGKEFEPNCHSCGQKKVWENADYQINQSDTHKIVSKKQWENQCYRNKVVAGVTKAHTNNPDYTTKTIAALQSTASAEKRIKAIKKKYDTDETYKQKLSKRRKEWLAIPGNYEKTLDILRSPAVRNSISLGVKRLWENPEYSAKIVANIKSAQEDHLARVLDDHKITYIRQFHLGHWPFDFMIPGTPHNILIEVQGNYHHGTKYDYTRPRDLGKETFVDRYHSDNYRLFKIWENEFLTPSKVIDFVAKITGKQCEPVQFTLSDLTLTKPDTKAAAIFLTTYHYMASSGRAGLNIGAFNGGKLIACARFCTPTRNESITRLKLKRGQLLELTRFAIHPSYQIKNNLASWLLGHCIKHIRKNKPQIKCLLTFADSTYGHIGTIYKASNWLNDGEIGPDYCYKSDDGFIMHKKTLWSHANKMGLSEREYARKYGYNRFYGSKKYRYLYWL